jgi:hypothetical protein
VSCSEQWLYIVLQPRMHINGSNGIIEDGPAGDNDKRRGTAAGTSSRTDAVLLISPSVIRRTSVLNHGGHGDHGEGRGPGTNRGTATADER